MAATSKRWKWLAVAGLMLVGMVWLSWQASGGVAAEDEKPKRAALPADLERAPRDAVGFLSIRVADLWSNPLVRNAPEVLREMVKHLGAAPENIERATVILIEAEPVVLVATCKPYDRKAVLEMFGAEPRTLTYLHHTLHVAPNGRQALHLFDEHTYVFGDLQVVKEFLGFPRDREDGPLSEALRQAATGHVQVVGVNGVAVSRILNRELAKPGQQLPVEVRPYLPLRKAFSATASLDLGGEARIDVRVRFDSERDAQAGARAIRKAWHWANVELTRAIEAARQQQGLESVVRLLQLADDALDAARIEQKGTTVTATLRAPLDEKTITLLFRDALRKFQESALRAQSQGSLKQIALALINYADSNQNQLPPHAIYDKNGKPLLSWRVLILPYIEQGPLYKEFHLDEPWDSPHNRKLLAKMPAIYAAGDALALKSHETYYQGFAGKGAIFEGKKGTLFPAGITDGTSQTILVAEAARAVPWTRPEDIPFDDSQKPGKELLQKVGGRFPDGFNAAFCDGSVHFLRKAINPRTLHALITRSAGDIPGSDF